MRRAQNQGYYTYGKGAVLRFRRGALKKGMSFDLTAESLENWWYSQPDICSYCGIGLNEYSEVKDFILSYKGNNSGINKFKRFYICSNHQKIKRMTIDRVCNDMGYEVKNLVKACWICNSLKNDFFDSDQMKLIAPEIIAKLRGEIKKERCSGR